MNYREKMKEYLKEPDEHSSQWGRWGILNKEQRDLIKRLLNEMDNADDVIKHQYFEIERLNNIIFNQNKRNSHQRIANDNLQNKNKELHSIIKEVREYITSYINQFNGVYPPVDMRYLDLHKLLDILKGENNE